MPHSAKLLQTGTLVPMKSSLPEVSSAAWASIVTGENSGCHNVFGFTDLMDGSYTLGFTSSRTFRAKPFWAREGAGPSLIMNVPQTYPAQPLDGMLVPRVGEVAWMRPEGRKAYFLGHVKKLRYEFLP